MGRRRPGGAARPGRAQHPAGRRGRICRPCPGGGGTARGVSAPPVGREGVLQQAEEA